MTLEKDSWYWISDPREGDIFYPVLATGTDKLIMDGKTYDLDDVAGLTLEKAIMPAA